MNQPKRVRKSASNVCGDGEKTVKHRTQYLVVCLVTRRQIVLTFGVNGCGEYELSSFYERNAGKKTMIGEELPLAVGKDRDGKCWKS